MRPDTLGTGLQEVGSSIEEAQNRMQRVDAASYVGTQAANLRVAAEQHLEANSQKPADILAKGGGFTPSVMNDFKATADAAIKGAPNGLARNMMQEHVANVGADLQIRAMKQEAATRIYQRATTAVQAAEHAATAVELNPSSWQDAGAEQIHAVQNMGLDPETTLKLSKEIDHVISTAAAKGYAKTDPDGTLKRLKDVNDPLFSNMSIEERERTQGYATGQVETNHANGVIAAYRGMGPVQGAKALQSVDKLDLPEEIKEGIRSKVEAGIGQFRQEQRQVNQQSIMGLETRLAAGKTNPGDVGLAYSLWRKGAWTAEQTGETVGRIEKAQQVEVDDNALEKAATQAYQNGQALDPHDKDWRKGIDATFQTATKGVQAGSAEWINRAADIGAKTGVTPDSVVDWSRAHLVSGDPQTAAAAANAIQRVTDANPRGTPFALDERTRAMSRMINDAVKAGTDPTTAVTNARQVTSLPDADVKRLDEIYKQKQLGSKAEGDLKTQLKADERFKPHFWSSIPDIPPQMTGEFEKLRQTYFKLTNGNPDQASKLAADDMKNVWGITQVNGKPEFMEFAPESMNPGLTTKAIQDDMRKAGEGHTWENSSSLRLVPTANTYQTRGQEWGIGAPDKFGAYSILTDDKGRPLRYQLPTATQGARQQYEKASQEGMARLKEAQAQQRARQQNMAGEVYAQGRQGGL
jgi:hypothetical protein